MNILSKGPGLAAKLVLACSAVAATGLATQVAASSHAEAPYITRQPKVDGTDFYMFRSYETGRSAFVTMIANYLPRQAPAGGPNFYMLDPDALYEIHIDNNGDAKEDVTFQFRFTSTNKDTTLPVGGKNISIPLIQSGAVSGVNPGALNVRETFTVQMVSGNRRSGNRTDVTNASGGSTTFDKPVDNIGNKTIANYAAYAAQHMYNINIPGCATAGKMFVGQRKDPFFLALGKIFDLINTNPLGSETGEVDTLAGLNVTTIALEVPIACLTAGSDPVIGGWTTASLRQARVLNPFIPGGASKAASKEGGGWTQVSRLGMPLVNEVVIGLKDKDRFNHSKPENDGQFADYVTNPSFPALVQLLFPAAAAPTKFPRTDLVAAFLTGISGLNQPVKATASEMLRLNTSIAPVAAGSQNRLGVLGGDAAGFPNGRRPADDIVDATVRVAMGVLCTLNQATVYGCVAADAPAGALAFTDGVATNPVGFDATFPYLKTPLPGSP